MLLIDIKLCIVKIEKLISIQLYAYLKECESKTKVEKSNIICLAGMRGGAVRTLWERSPVQTVPIGTGQHDKFLDARSKMGFSSISHRGIHQIVPTGPGRSTTHPRLANVRFLDAHI